MSLKQFNFTRYCSSPWFGLVGVMMFFNIPSFLLSFFTEKKYLISDLNAVKNNLSYGFDIIFFYRPFPDPFTISVDILLLVFLASFMLSTRYRFLLSVYITCLFLYQWYANFIVFFYNKSPNFNEDMYFFFQLPTILNLSIIILITVLIGIIFFSSTYFFRFFSKYIGVKKNARFNKKIFLLLLICFSWNTYLNIQVSNNSIMKYLITVQFTTLNVLNYVYDSFNFNDLKADKRIESFQDLSYQDIDLNNEFPNVFLMIIESYGDINLILNKQQRLDLEIITATINSAIKREGIFSISSYSKHLPFGTFANFNSIVFGRNYTDTRTISLFKESLIKQNSLNKKSLFDFFKKNGFTNVGLMPSLTYDSFKRFNFNSSDYSKFYDMDLFYIGSDIHDSNDDKAFFGYPDRVFLNDIFDTVDINSNNRYFLTYISSNSHWPFKHYNNSSEKDAFDRKYRRIKGKFCLTCKLDQLLNIDGMNFNFSLVKTYLQTSILNGLSGYMDSFIDFLFVDGLTDSEMFFEKKSYKQAIEYQYESILDVVNYLKTDPFILFIIGDHQPHFYNYSNITPIHILTNDKRYLSNWMSYQSFTEGFHFNSVDKIELSHHEIPQLLIDSLVVDHYAF